MYVYMIDSNTNTFFTEGGLHSPLSTGTGYDISFTGGGLHPFSSERKLKCNKVTKSNIVKSNRTRNLKPNQL